MVGPDCLLSLGFEPGELRSGDSGGSSEVWGDVCAEMPDDQPHFQVTWAGDGSPWKTVPGGAGHGAVKGEWGGGGRVGEESLGPDPGAGPQGGRRRSSLRRWGQDKAVRSGGLQRAGKRGGVTKMTLGNWAGSVQGIPGIGLLGRGHKEGQGGSKAGRGLGMGTVPASL